MIDCIIPFGKYKGEMLSHVYKQDKKYFEFLCSIDTYGKLKESIQSILTDKNEETLRYVEECIDLIRILINKGEKVYYLNIHNVGEEFRLGSYVDGIDIENILNKTFTLNNRKITKKQYKKIYDILYPLWEKQGKLTKSRGLY